MAESDLVCVRVCSGLLLGEMYKSKLEAFEYQVEDPLNEPVFTNSKEAPMYRLLFVSKSPLGNKFWQDVTSKLINGQMTMF